MKLSIYQNQNLNKIYLSEAIRNFGLGMVQVFIPIYLLINGYSLGEVAIFYIASSLTHLLMAIPAGWLGSKIGYKWLILLSVPFFIIFFILLQDISRLLVPLWLLGILKEIGATCYWVGRHSFLGFYTDREKLGSQVGISNIIISIANMPSPLIGGIILSFLDIHFLVIVVLIILLISVIPLIFIHEDWHDTEFSIKKVFSELHLRNAPIFMTQGFDNVMTFDLVWPVYLYLFMSFKYISLGFINLIGGISSLFSNYAIGLLTDKDDKKVLKIGAIGAIILWLMRLLINTPLQAYVVGLIEGLDDQLISIPFNATSYRIARDNHFLQLIVFREMAIHAGKLLAFSAVLFIGSLQYVLLLGLIYPFGYLLIGFYEKKMVREPSSVKNASPLEIIPNNS